MCSRPKPTLADACCHAHACEGCVGVQIEGAVRFPQEVSGGKASQRWLCLAACAWHSAGAGLQGSPAGGGQPAEPLLGIPTTRAQPTGRRHLHTVSPHIVDRAGLEYTGVKHLDFKTPNSNSRALCKLHAGSSAQAAAAGCVSRPVQVNRAAAASDHQWQQQSLDMAPAGAMGACNASRHLGHNTQ